MVQKKLQSNILLEFTKELIRHSSQGEVFKLENILEKESEERGVKIKEERDITEGMQISKISSEKGIGQKIDLKLKEKIKIPLRPLKKVIPSHLVISSPKLPPRFQYLKPTPTNIEIDLGKLNPLIKDPMVKNIECPGANQDIIVTGMMGRKRTDITLKRIEIEKIIKKFSEETKIPAHEGVFRVVVGKIIFSAIVSSIISSKFIIR